MSVTERQEKMGTKVIRIDEWSHEIFRLEAHRQSMKPNTAITVGIVLRQYAEKLNKKHKFVSGI